MGSHTFPQKTLRRAPPKNSRAERTVFRKLKDYAESDETQAVVDSHLSVYATHGPFSTLCLSSV